MKANWLVVQQGGSTHEFYPRIHRTKRDADADVRSCAKGSYNCVGPVAVPPELLTLADESFEVLMDAFKAVALDAVDL